MYGINNDPAPAVSCFQRCRNTPPVRETVALFRNHPSIEHTINTIFKTSQLVATGYCSWKAVQIIDDPLKEPDAPIDPELVITTFIASALLCAAIAGPILRTFCNQNGNFSFCSFISNPLLVFGAACLGIAISSKQQFNRAGDLWNNISQINSEISNRNQLRHAEFQQGIQNCFDFIADNQNALALPGCYNCHMTSDTAPFSIISTTVYSISPVLQTWFHHFNQTVCPPTTYPATESWQYFTSMTFNETYGPWPCFPAWSETNLNNKTLAGTATILAYLLDVISPFSVTVTPLLNNSEGCVHAQGYGAQEFELQMICGYTKAKYEQLPSSWLACLSDEAKNYIENYTSNFEPYSSIASVPFPETLVSLVQKGKTEKPYIVFSYALLTSMFAYLLWITDCGRGNRERQPLLAANQQEV